MTRPPDRRPVLIALAGPNGAGKTTFFHAHLASAGLRFVNADVLARELGMEDAYDAARAAGALRRELLRQRVSFVFETVFSDPKGDKLSFLEDAVKQGYDVTLCFIGLSGPDLSEERVAMRVSQGGHDVPAEKLVSRFARTLANLKASVSRLPHIWIYDNSDLRAPFRKIAVYDHGRLVFQARRRPSWFAPLLDDPS